MPPFIFLASFAIYRVIAIPILAVLFTLNAIDGKPLGENITTLWYFAFWALLGYAARHLLQDFIDERRENRITSIKPNS